jgi:Uma2 family endonuclease
MVTKPRLTVEEYLALPERKPYLEYDEGESVQKMAPDAYHVQVAGRLLEWLVDYRRLRGGILGPEPRLELPDDAGGSRFLIPDVAYWAPGKPFHGPRAMHPPTLAIEILSPGESRERQRRKCRIYIAHAVDVAWLIDPRRQTVERFGEGHDGDAIKSGELTAAVLPGLSIPIAALFEGLDEEPR